MRSDLPYITAKIVSLNDNRLVGKTRLQKTFYFLEEFDVGFGISFEYHHYGPYSEDLNTAVDDAEDLGIIDVQWKNTQAGTSYAVFSSKISPEEERSDKKRKNILRALSRFDSVVVELAATADFLEKNGYATDPWKETRVRKPEKATIDRLNKAKVLLDELKEI